MTGRVLALLVVVAAATGFAPAPQKARIGKPAPDFTLPDLDGTHVGLARYRDKVLVLQWFNADCPFNARVFRNGTVKRTLDVIKRLGPGYAYVAINSTAVVPADELTRGSRKFLKEMNVDVTVLIDADGDVGRRYDARTTPQVFVIERGVLRYSGAFTDNPWAESGKAKNYAVQALQRIAAGEKVEPDQVRPWGCSVKYGK